MNQELDVYRGIKIVKKTIADLKLDLSGCKVLTEIGTNAYFFTPFIAAMAGAEKVYIKTNLQTFNSELVTYYTELTNELSINSVFHFCSEELSPEIIGDSDIITNLGHIRPFNRELISKMKRNRAVIPLMYDRWEFRESDIDTLACKEYGIRVAGTWEMHPDIQVFLSCGQLALKMVFEAGMEVFANSIIIWSDDDFGEIIRDAFLANGAKNVILTTDRDVLKEKMQEADFLFICDYSEERPIISEGGLLNDVLKGSGLNVIHLFGNICPNISNELKIKLFPKKIGHPKRMTFTLAHLGLLPIIRLNASGLKVAEYVLKNEENSLAQRIV